MKSCIQLWIILAALLSLVACAPGKAPSPELIQTNRFIQPWGAEELVFETQPEKHAIIIELLGKNTNIRSEIIDLDNNILSAIEVPYLRSAPVYHLIEPDEPGSHLLRITPKQATKDSDITVNLYALPSDTKFAQETLAAWQALTRGIQIVEGEDEADWKPNLKALEQAAEQFDDLGAHEPELWARYFNAYFRYFPLYQYEEALDIAEDLISNAGTDNHEELLMLAHQLAGQILIELDPAILGESREEVFARARNHFRQTLDMSRDLENGFETIWTYNNLGITSHYQGRPQQSLDEYGKALDLAIELQDHWLISLIGMNVAVSQESMGEINRAIATLHRIENELGDDGDPLDIEHLWSLLGGYYLKRYQFPRALEFVDKALNLSEELGIAESTGRNQLLLAQIYRQLGQAENSLQNVQLAIPNLNKSRNARGLRRAYDLKADLHRETDQFEAMQRARLKQEEYLANESDRARWIWGAARDALSISDHQGALKLFEESASLFNATAFEYLGQLALLHACHLKITLSHQSCSSVELEPQISELIGHEASSEQMEGRYLLARLQANEGRIIAAHKTMDDLIEDLSYFRHSLPGVLGAWYWDARAEVFDFYLQLAIQAEASEQERALASLTAMDRLRNLGLRRESSNAHSGQPQSINYSGTELREMLAQRDAAESVAEIEEAERGIDLMLLEIRRSGPAALTAEAQPGLRNRIEALPDGWSILTYQLTDNLTYAWTGSKSDLKLHQLKNGEEIRHLLQSAKREIRTFNSEQVTPLLTELGTRLVKPIAADLEPNVLLIGSGALSDFPFETLIVDGQFLIKSHQINNTMSLADPSATIAAIEADFNPGKLFIAGNPDLTADQAPSLEGAATELKSLAEHFPDTSSKLYEQNNLHREAFEDPDFDSSNLIHIASHATVDTAYPELSRIELTNDFLTPTDLAGRKISAELVVLSACSTVGLNRFDYDSHLGFVSEFLATGASQVMASLWPVSDQLTASFFDQLYSDLSGNGTVAESLREIKWKMIDAGESSVDQWSAFQLYVR